MNLISSQFKRNEVFTARLRKKFSIRINSPEKVVKISNYVKSDIHQVNTNQNTQICEETSELFSPDHLEIQSPLFSNRFASGSKVRQSLRSKINESNKSPNIFRSVLIQQSQKQQKIVRRVQSPCDQIKKSYIQQMHSTATSLKKYKFNIPDSITAASYLVMNKKTRNVILGNNIETKRQIASITKLMTILTALHICKEYQIQLFTPIVTVQQEAAQMEGTTASLKYGDQLSIIDLIYGMMLPSGNDAASALAQYIGNILVDNNDYQQPETDDFKLKLKKIYKGYDLNNKKDSLKYFVHKMNYLANKFGFINTRFQNPTGLQGNASFSTAYDVALISSYCIDHPIIRVIMEKKTYRCAVYNIRVCAQRVLYWKNTNKLLWRRRECIGLKTGTTPWAGACLSAAFKIRSTQIIIIVLKGLNSQQRFNDVNRLYTWYKHEYFLQKNQIENFE